MADEDAIEMLKADHKKVKKLFAEYESAEDGPPQQKQRIAEQVFQELEVHATLEEEIFYPAVQAEADDEDKKLVAEAIEEHRIVKTLIEELKELEPTDEQYDAKMKVLTENVEHHAEEEEDEMFPVAEDLLGERLETIGMQMQQRKAQLTGARAA